MSLFITIAEIALVMLLVVLLVWALRMRHLGIQRRLGEQGFQNIGEGRLQVYARVEGEWDGDEIVNQNRELLPPPNLR